MNRASSSFASDNPEGINLNSPGKIPGFTKKYLIDSKPERLEYVNADCRN